MLCDNIRSGYGITISAFALIALAGCFSSSGLPSSVLVELPDGTTVEAVQGSGAPSLANSTWVFSNEQGAAFVTIRFGPAGNLERFEDNTIAQEILGSTIIFDGQRQPTGLSGVEYAAATFGAETTDATGFSFESRLNVFAPLVGRVGSGQASATGELEPGDPNTMTGNFSFSFEVSLPFPLPIPEEDLSGDIRFIARRVVE